VTQYFRMFMSVSEKEDESFGWSPRSPRRTDGQPSVAGVFSAGSVIDPQVQWEIESVTIFTEPTDFTLTNDGPIVTKRLGKFIRDVDPDGIQLIPVTVKGITDTEFEILNVIRLIPAIDLTKSVGIDTFTDISQGISRIHHINKIRLSSNVNSHFHIFRSTEWLVPIFVSELLKNRIQEGLFTGIDFQALT
jgi:hypothetical protein